MRELRPPRRTPTRREAPPGRLVRHRGRGTKGEPRRSRTPRKRPRRRPLRRVCAGQRSKAATPRGDRSRLIRRDERRRQRITSAPAPKLISRQRSVPTRRPWASAPTAPLRRLDFHEAAPQRRRVFDHDRAEHALFAHLEVLRSERPGAAASLAVSHPRGELEGERAAGSWWGRSGGGATKRAQSSRP